MTEVNLDGHNMEERIREIKTHGTAARGKRELLCYLRGGSLQRSQAITAKCYDCMGCYADGKLDCLLQACPLYGFMPYKGNRRNSNG